MSKNFFQTCLNTSIICEFLHQIKLKLLIPAHFFTTIIIHGFSICLAQTDNNRLASNKVTWEKIDIGLEVSKIKSSQYVFFSSELIFVRIDPQFYHPGIVTAQDIGEKVADVQSLVTKTGGSIGLNANFFDKKESPLGLVISRGKVIHSIQTAGNLLKGIFFSGNNKLQIVNRLNFYKKGVKDAFQAGPILIQDGIATTMNKTNYEKRSGICIDHNNNVILLASDSNVFGYSLQEIQEALQMLNCVSALNLDGGGSTQLYVGNSNLESEIKEAYNENSSIINIRGIDKIPVGLVFFKRTLKK